MCGIRVAGENHFVIAPHPGGHFDYARSSYDSVYGRVESGWKRERKADGKDGVTYTVIIPPNCTADFVLPNGERRILGPGRQVIES
jgi:alpha-L-rhamnosidase